MIDVDTCPAPEQLQQLVLGLLNTNDAVALERHVELCQRCGQVLSGLQAVDALVDTMRAHRVTIDLAPGDRSQIEQMLPRLERLYDAATDSTVPREPGRPCDIAALLAPAQQPDELGRLGPYRILRLLGQGGMGVVFVADDPQLQRHVALKVMLPEVADQPAARGRFLREARSAAKIQHDHIVTVYQVGDDHGVLYVAMQLLSGTSLEDFLREKESLARPPLPVAEVLRLGRQIALGLAAAHQTGLLHRDIKPGNIWLDASAGGRVKLLDFGLAQPLEEDPGGASGGMLAGTVPYMAPEQLRGAPADARSDLFSLGCVLYRLCAGCVPWPDAGRLSGALLSGHVEAPVSIAALNPALPPELSRLVMRLIECDPQLRPQSAAAVATQLERIEQAAVGGKTKKRSRWLIGVCLAGVIALAAFWVGLHHGQPHSAAPSSILVNSLGMKLVRIPAGRFEMGSPTTEPGRFADEQLHEVTITRPFYLGMFCVTTGQYRQFVAATNYRGDSDGAWQSPGFEPGDDHPVGEVSWNDAVAFCQWLSQKEGREYRLPTEAEWEYACRAGTQSAWFFGDNPRLFSQYAYTLSEQRHPMSPLKPNPWGLYDMYGNQWQWTSDWYASDFYEHSPATDPGGPPSGTFRMQRGGSLYMGTNYCRSAARHGIHPPTWHKPHVGFRVAASVEDFQPEGSDKQ